MRWGSGVGERVGEGSGGVEGEGYLEWHQSLKAEKHEEWKYCLLRIIRINRIKSGELLIPLCLHDYSISFIWMSSACYLFLKSSTIDLICLMSIHSTCFLHSVMINVLMLRCMQSPIRNNLNQYRLSSKIYICNYWMKHVK